MSEQEKPKASNTVAWIILILILAGGILYYFQKSFFVQIESYEKAVVFRFGKALPKALEPGPYFKFLPSPYEKIERLDVQKDRKILIGFTESSDSSGNITKTHQEEEGLMLTADANLIDIEAAINYSINDIVMYITKVHNQEETLKDASESALKTVIGLYPINEVLTDKKAQIADDIRKKLQAIIDTYQLGVDISRVQLIKVLNPQKVRDAFESVESAKLDSSIMVEEAKGYRNKELPKAKGTAHKIIEAAKADSVARITDAQGQVAEFKAIYAQYRKSKNVTRKRLYLEAMEQIMPNVNTYIVNDKNQNLNLLNLGGK